MSSPLLHQDTVADLVRDVTTAAVAGAARMASAEQPHEPASHAQIAAELAHVDLDSPLPDFDAAVDELDRTWLRHAVWFHHPRTLAHLNCPVAVPAVAVETLATAVNVSLDTWDQSKAATVMERQLLAWTAGRIGFPEGADGMFTPGGTTSNLQALMLARDECLERSALVPGAAPRPVRAASLRILASAESHFSVVTAAHVLGLDDDCVVPVPVDDRGRLSVPALRRVVADLESQSLTPMAVVATAGTTDRGVIDPLPELAELCAAQRIWLHVDAAYGGGLLVSPAHRDRLAGIEGADSVTVDFHKTWFQPVSCSAVLVRDGRTLRHCTHHAAYLNPADTPEPNQVDRSLQTTRRFDALKLWVTLRTLGPDAIGRLLDTVIDLAARTADALREDPRFELVCEPSLSTVLFRWQPPAREDGPEDPDRWVRAIRRAVWDTGRATVAETEIAGRPCLKLTLLNPETTDEDVRAVLDLVHETALSLLTREHTGKACA
ncbi:aspartate aminotransferase family protein [Kocuria rhizophila]|uniref:pyridoxal phosphate-dependent decarboxylase family protein n=1 Tax=Kocuria rhizophila TaxID=72000 RepID=UPI000F52569C|nr:aspartate aminotransferase family protein [Kocuria rhizophila]MBO4145643.1 aspartate aminotransferase family protein [Kocuria rhizophila]MDN3225719.1 aspartate aminotransferase family protein [Kocuria rhizophila]QTK32502.1 aspartate aminotransferase family protein [Kocuria rhizophila]